MDRKTCEQCTADKFATVCIAAAYAYHGHCGDGDWENAMPCVFAFAHGAPVEHEYDDQTDTGDVGHV